MSAYDQIERIQKAAATNNYDVIGVDVADIAIVKPVINKLIDKGYKVMTFSSSDSGKENGCKRIAYVGNTHNYEDGKILALQDCYAIGFDTITTAVKIADGLLPGLEYPERTEETTTVFFQKDAKWLLRSLVLCGMYKVRKNRLRL